MTRPVLAAGVAALCLVGATAHAQDTGINIPGCPLSGCTYQGAISYGNTTVGGAASGWKLATTGTATFQTSGAAVGLKLNRGDAAGVTGSLFVLSTSEENAAGTASIEFGRYQCSVTSITAGAEAGQCDWYVALNGTDTDYLRLTAGHLNLLQGAVVDHTGGTAPVLTGFGTSPSDTSATDEGGRIKVGSSPSTTGSLAFYGTHAITPTCTVVRESGTAVAFTPSTTGISMTSSAAFVAAEYIDYTCVFHG